MKKDKNSIRGNSAQARNADKFRGILAKVNQVSAAVLLSTGAVYWGGLLSFSLLCGAMTGCGGDDDSVSVQDQDLIGKGVAYVDANGELSVTYVDAIQGDTLFVSNIYGEGELQRSEVLGIGPRSPHTLKTIVIAKGNYLDAYGDRFADIEYLIGGISRSYYLDGEPTVADVKISLGDTASGEEIDLHRETGGYIELYIRVDEILRLE